MTREQLIEKLWEEQSLPFNGHVRVMDESSFLMALNSALDEKRDELEPYCVHDNDCPLSMWSEGRPTADGGYEIAFEYGPNKKWYPIGEHPPCTCGLLKALGYDPEVEG